jgi:hypothetical protein
MSLLVSVFLPVSTAQNFINKQFSVSLFLHEKEIRKKELFVTPKYPRGRRRD